MTKANVIDQFMWQWHHACAGRPPRSREIEAGWALVGAPGARDRHDPVRPLPRQHSPRDVAHTDKLQYPRPWVSADEPELCTARWSQRRVGDVEPSAYITVPRQAAKGLQRRHGRVVGAWPVPETVDQ